MKVHFTAAFDFSPAALNGTVTTAYEAGKIYAVTRECADMAVASGKGEIVKERGRRPDANLGDGK